MTPTKRSRSSLLHRSFIWSLSGLLTLLLIWALGFVLRDIGDSPGPQYDEVEDEFVAEELRDEIESLEKEMATLGTQISNQRQTQSILRESMNESRAAMDQFIDIHRLNLEKGVTPSAEEQRALAESQSRFLSKQTEFQAATEQIASLGEQQRTIQDRLRSLGAEKDDQAEEAREEYRARREVHQIKIAAFKLLFAVPLLAFAAWLVVKKRASVYAPIFMSLLVAAFWRVGAVMNEHLPSEWFRYIAIAAGIAVVVFFLVQLIRTAASPKLDWLLKQYRAAYNRRRCPICAHPILRGPLRHAIWTGKGPKGLVAIPREGEDAADEAYRCPSCGEPLFEKCESCEAVRHSLLPYCEHCGAEKPIAGVPADRPAEA